MLRPRCPGAMRVGSELTMIVSLEAIFLSLFVLISQSRQAVHDKLRNDIEYETNFNAELEVRNLSHQIEDRQEGIRQHLSRMSTIQAEELTKRSNSASN